MKKVNNIIRIPASVKGNFFKYWLKFLLPFHHLAEREMDVLASLLKQRFELSKVIKDEALLDKNVLGDTIRESILKECNITLPHYYVIIGKLRKSGIIIDDKINPKFLPNITEEKGNFQLLLLFDLNDKD